MYGNRRDRTIHRVPSAYPASAAQGGDAFQMHTRAPKTPLRDPMHPKEVALQKTSSFCWRLCSCACLLRECMCAYGDYTRADVAESALPRPVGYLWWKWACGASGEDRCVCDFEYYEYVRRQRLPALGVVSGIAAKVLVVAAGVDLGVLLHYHLVWVLLKVGHVVRGVAALEHRVDRRRLL